MCTELQLNEIIKKIVQSYKKIYGNKIEQIILYGSYARGDCREDSDIDIVAIVHGGRIELQEKLKIIWDISAEVGLENDIVVSPTVIPYEEYEKYRHTLPYYRNIAEEGRKIG